MVHVFNDRQLLTQLEDALHRLRDTAGVEAHVVALEPGQGQGAGRPDAIIEIQAAGKNHRLIVEAKTQVDRFAAVGHVKTQLEAFGKPGLLFVPYITAAVAKECRKIDLPFLDTAGNVYLKFPELLVYVTGEKPQNTGQKQAVGTRGGTAAALRVIFALLCEPALLNAPYRDIVRTAGVALGAVGWIFIDLEQRGYIAGAQRKRNRRFLEPQRLFDEWVTNYPIKLRPKLNRATFRADDPDWWHGADVAGAEGYWGGEVAAHRLTGYLKPKQQTIYVPPEHRKALLAKLVARHRLKADRAGTVEILDTFWQLPPDEKHADIVPPILAYADLVATLDPRNMEAAMVLRTEHLDDTLGKR